MAVTCCPLQGSDDGDGPSCSWSEIRRARKQHVCCECRKPIPPGARYKYESGIWDGRPESYKTCLLCVEIRDHFACNGWLYEQMWSDLRENFFPDMSAGGQCMNGLSPEAKQKLIDARMDWYFAQDEIDDSAWEDWPKHKDRQRPLRVVLDVEEKVPYYETPEYYWPRQLQLERDLEQYEREVAP